ncbi:MAG: hypothetical protein RQ826_11720 [Xanthomonadales bacterium]|nr:hypothetical protein [Xanthomonadales bacterium]
MNSIRRVAVLIMTNFFVLPAVAQDAESDAMLRAISGNAAAPAGRDVNYFEAESATTGYLALPAWAGTQPIEIEEFAVEWPNTRPRDPSVANDGRGASRSPTGAFGTSTTHAAIWVSTSRRAVNSMSGKAT